MFAVPEFTSQSVAAMARPRSPIARYWAKLSSHSTGHRKSRILPNQKFFLTKYSREEAHSFRLIKQFGVRCTLSCWTSLLYFTGSNAGRDFRFVTLNISLFYRLLTVIKPTN